MEGITLIGILITIVIFWVNVLFLKSVLGINKLNHKVNIIEKRLNNQHNQINAIYTNTNFEEKTLSDNKKYNNQRSNEVSKVHQAFKSKDEIISTYINTIKNSLIKYTYTSDQVEAVKDYINKIEYLTSYEKKDYLEQIENDNSNITTTLYNLIDNLNKT